MDELRKSVNWSAPNVDEHVNQLLRKLALARLQDYQKEGSRTFGEVYNDKGQKVKVADEFKYMLSYYQVLPRDLPAFNKYIVDYPNAKLPNVQNTFRWERVNFGLKPTLFIIQVLMRSTGPIICLPAGSIMARRNHPRCCCFGHEKKINGRLSRGPWKCHRTSCALQLGERSS